MSTFHVSYTAANATSPIHTITHYRGKSVHPLPPVGAIVQFDRHGGIYTVTGQIWHVGDQQMVDGVVDNPATWVEVALTPVEEAS